MTQQSDDNVLGLIIYVSLESLQSPLKETLQLVSYAAKITKKQIRIILDCNEIVKNISTPRRIWRKLQNVITELYISATMEAYEIDNPLLNVDVILGVHCGYDAWVETDDLPKNTFEAVLLTTSEIDLNVVYEANKRRKITGLLPLKFLPIPSLSYLQCVVISENSTSSNAKQYDYCGPNPPDIYDHVAMGGTFDHLHSGHKILLTISAWLAKLSMFCGVISPKLLKNKECAHMLEPIDTRIDNVKKFLTRLRKGGELLFEIDQIDDPYGPPKENPKFSAIVGSFETLKGCEAVNEMRSKNRINPPLDIYVIDVISKNARVGQDEMESKISSTYIRRYLASHQQQS